jgi:hypothetical protein
LTQINTTELITNDRTLPLERPGADALKIYLARLAIYIMVVVVNLGLLGLILIAARLPAVLILLLLATGIIAVYVYLRLKAYLAERPFPVLEAVVGSALGLLATIALAAFVPQSLLINYRQASESLHQRFAAPPTLPTPLPATPQIVVLVTQVKSPLPTNTPTPPPDTPTPTPSATPTRALPTSTPTATPTPEPPTPTPTATPAPRAPTNTPAPAIPAGILTLLAPRGDDTSGGPTTFEWTWSGALPPDHGFEVRVWREGGIPAGIHDAILDNREGRVQQTAANTYRLTVDITEAPGVQRVSGQYLWTVLLVRISPAYQDLGIQAEPAPFKFESSGGAPVGG